MFIFKKKLFKEYFKYVLEQILAMGFMIFQNLKISPQISTFFFMFKIRIIFKKYS